MTDITTIETPGLGDRTYVVSDGEVAAVIDPQRDIDRVLAVVDAEGLTVSHILETHIHNDYVTGGPELAATTGATYVVAAADDVAYERHPVGDGDELEVGTMRFRAVHTPGHTPAHLSYVLLDGGQAVAAFTGGSMLFGAVGRTDLIADDVTEELTRAQWRSVRRLAAELPDGVTVHPTHGFGSFCSSAKGSDADSSTVGQERDANLALTVDDEDAFVEQLLSGLTAYPRYYAHMGPVNRRGPAPVDLSMPEEVDPAELRRRVHAGEWVVDLRDRRAFARSHLGGTISVELDDPFATYVGWTIPWGTPVTLVGDTVEDVAQAQRQLVRIGIDRPAGRATGGVDRYGAGGDVRSYRVASFEELATEQERDDLVVLDVRRDDERQEGHLPGSVHIPLPDLEDRMGELPDAELWVHCASGFRSSIAASLVDRAGRRVVLVDDDWEKAADAGLEVVTEG